MEVPYDGIDQDCDGEDIVDIDGDGVSPPEDCDDHDPDRYSGAVDIPLDGEDQDCTGWDADAHLIGGAGWNCGGCSTGGAGPMAPWWLVGLGAWGVRRRR